MRAISGVIRVCIGLLCASLANPMVHDKPKAIALKGLLLLTLKDVKAIPWGKR